VEDLLRVVAAARWTVLLQVAGALAHQRVALAIQNEKRWVLLHNTRTSTAAQERSLVHAQCVWAVLRYRYRQVSDVHARQVLFGNDVVYDQIHVAGENNHIHQQKGTSKRQRMSSAQSEEPGTNLSSRTFVISLLVVK
jgi:hypothetical protein